MVSMGAPEELKGNVGVLRQEGRLTMTLGTAHPLIGAARLHLDAGIRVLILDMTKVSSVDPWGVEVLLELVRLARSHGVHLCACSPNEGVQATLRVTTLTTLLEVFPTEVEARAAFGRAA